MRRLVGILIVTVLTVACTAGGEAPDEAGATVPDGWQQHEFDGGTVATPGDWSEVEPIDTDDLTLRGPAPADGLPAIARVQVTDRDAAPFDSLQQLAAAQLTLQFGDVEPGEEEELELAGADRAGVASYRYEAEVEGEPVEIGERFVVAWFGDDRQAQLRIGAPVSRIDEELATIEQVIASLQFDAP